MRSSIVRKAQMPDCASGQRHTHDRRLSLGAWIIAVVFGLVGAAHAQLYSGSISGTVTDPTGAVVVGAHVMATDRDKGFTYPGTTDSSGRYVLRSIPPGTYSVTARAKGFQTQRQSGIVAA